MPGMDPISDPAGISIFDGGEDDLSIRIGEEFATRGAEGTMNFIIIVSNKPPSAEA